MIVERFKNGDAIPVYRRFRDRGRLAPDVNYVNSWVTQDLKACYQIMEAPHRDALEAWIEQWKDLVDFEVSPVITSAEAVAAITPRL